MTNLPFSELATESLLDSPKAQAADGAPAETPASKGRGEAGAQPEPLLKNSAGLASAGSLGPCGIIPVGQEPKRLYDVEDSHSAQRGGQVSPRRGAGGAATDPRRSQRDIDNKTRGQIRNPSGLHQYRSALQEKQVFVLETLRRLRRAEANVWLAIHSCQGATGARISQARIMAIAGIRSRKNVSEAVRSLQARGLLEVLFKGKYRPNGSGNHGLASIYCVYPRPEPRVVELMQQTKEKRAAKNLARKKPR